MLLQKTTMVFQLLHLIFVKDEVYKHRALQTQLHFDMSRGDFILSEQLACAVTELSVHY
jgi:hypothetical protein